MSNRMQAAWAIAAGIAFLLLCAAAPLRAGDFAVDAPVGFSVDGRYFAFEEFGVQDGSGFPYANLYVIDLERDAWVSGTPIRVRREAEDAGWSGLAAVRGEARARAGGILADLGVRAPALELFARGIGEARGAPARVTVAVPNPSFPMAEPWGRLDLVLETIAAPSPLDFCPEPTRGFRLTRIDAAGGARVLHADARVPRSRGCAVDYRLTRVLAPGFPAAGATGVAVISVFASGFEGLDRRFIALPVPLP